MTITLRATRPGLLAPAPAFVVGGKQYVAGIVPNTATLRGAPSSPARVGETLIFYGTLDEYLTGENDKPVKSVYRWRDADHFTYEVHDLAIGEENTKVFEVAYSRAK